MENNENTNEFAKHYSEESFWDKVKNFAVKAGKEVIEKALILYYCFADKDTPAWAKAIILGALGYFILPIDAIPDAAPLIGFTDDLGVIVAASVAVAAHIKKEHIELAKQKIKEWFGEDDKNEPTVTEEKK